MTQAATTSGAFFSCTAHEVNESDPLQFIDNVEKHKGKIVQSGFYHKIQSRQSDCVLPMKSRENEALPIDVYNVFFRKLAGSPLNKTAINGIARQM